MCNNKWSSSLCRITNLIMTSCMLFVIYLVSFASVESQKARKAESICCRLCGHKSFIFLAYCTRSRRSREHDSLKHIETSSKLENGIFQNKRLGTKGCELVMRSRSEKEGSRDWTEVTKRGQQGKHRVHGSDIRNFQKDKSSKAMCGGFQGFFFWEARDRDCHTNLPVKGNASDLIKPNTFLVLLKAFTTID